MPRANRHHIPGQVWHITHRCHKREFLFRFARDRKRVHAFCLMGNHIHLAIQVSDIPLSRIMQNLSFRYTRWINSSHKRMGHLFQGRYKALLVDKDSYLLELVRYIHLNPVRAGLVGSPVDYEWSGHRSYLGKEHIPWLTCDTVLAQFGSTVKAGREQYASFVMDAIDEKHRPEFHRGSDDSRVLGEDHFLQQVMAQTDDVAVKISLDDLLALVAREFAIDITDLCSVSRKRNLTESRGVAAWLVAETGQHTLAELAKCMHRDPSALSLQAKKVRERAMKETQFRKRLDEIKSELLHSNSITHP